MNSRLDGDGDGAGAGDGDGDGYRIVKTNKERALVSARRNSVR